MDGSKYICRRDYGSGKWMGQPARHSPAGADEGRRVLALPLRLIEARAAVRRPQPAADAPPGQLFGRFLLGASRKTSLGSACVSCRDQAPHPRHFTSATMWTTPPYCCSGHRLGLQPPPRYKNADGQVRRRGRTSSTAVIGFGIAGMLRASVMVGAYAGTCASKHDSTSNTLAYAGAKLRRSDCQ